MEFSIANIFRAIAAASPNRTAIVHRNKRMTYAELDMKTDQLAKLLISKGIGLHKERHKLQSWESGQDHIAIYMRNRPEYIETLLAAMKARATGFNVNFRFTETELTYLLDNADTSAIIYEAKFVEQIVSLSNQRKTAEPYKLLLQVDEDLLTKSKPNYLCYEREIARQQSGNLNTAPSPDDIFLLFTGGTTGMPKGVLWRQADVINTLIGTKLDSIDAIVDRALSKPAQRFLLLPPFMHGTAQWNALSALFGGNEIHIQDNVDSLKPDEILSLVEREKINVISMVGDAFGRPICEALNSGAYDFSSITHILNSGAILSKDVKAAFLAAAPDASVVDTIGASESGPQAKRITSLKTATKVEESSIEAKFKAGATTVVVNENKTRLLLPGHKGEGWLAKRSTIPFGYLGDPEKTKTTFVVIEGIRYSVPGDRVRLLEDGTIDFCGRDATTINSGGEKIFAEEVEGAVRFHPEVADAIVSSRPSERWGNEVVAIIQSRSGSEIPRNEIIAECGKHIARYKIPKQILFVENIKRGDNGKADLKWAKSLAESSNN